MEVKENDVHRAARDIGHAVIDTLQVRLAAAVNNNELRLEPEQLELVLELVKKTGKEAIENATNVYLRSFEAHKKTSSPKE